MATSSGSGKRGPPVRSASDLDAGKTKLPRWTNNNRPFLRSAAARTQAQLPAKQQNLSTQKHNNGGTHRSQPVHANVPTANMFVVNDKPLDEYEADMDDVTQNTAVQAVQSRIKTQPIIVVGSSASEMQNLLNAVVKVSLSSV